MVILQMTNVSILFFKHHILEMFKLWISTLVLLLHVHANESHFGWCLTFVQSSLFTFSIHATELLISEIFLGNTLRKSQVRYNKPFQYFILSKLQQHYLCTDHQDSRFRSVCAKFLNNNNDYNILISWEELDASEG